LTSIEESKLYDLEKDLEKNVAIIAKDVSQYQQFQEKFSTAIDKLTDISNNLAKMVSMHGSMLENHGKLVDDLYVKIERIKESGLSELKIVSKDLTTLESHNTDKHFELMTKIDSVRNEFNKRIDDVSKEMDERLQKTEKYVWMFLGAGTLLGFIASYVVPIATKLIH